MPCQHPGLYLAELPEEGASPDACVEPLLQPALPPELVYILYCLVPLGTSPLDTPYAFGTSLFNGIILLHQILQASRICIAV